MLDKSQISDDLLLPILETLPLGVLLVDKAGVITFSNPKACELFGYKIDELPGVSISELIPKRYHQHHESIRTEYMQAPSLRAMNDGRILPAQKKNGDEIQITVGLSPLAGNEKNYTLVSIIEITNQIMKVASYRDPLTGLPNRDSFTVISDNIRNLAIRNRVCLTLMFIDLNGFKAVNDNHGHDVGDLVLCKVADILYKNIRKSDIVARIGGDEFIMCYYGIDDNKDIKNLSNKLIKTISSIDQINGNNIDISASMGVVSVQASEDVLLNEMVKMADELMYKAKKSGKGKVFIENI